MLTYSSKEARANWREMLDAIYLHKQDVVIERNGKPVAVLLSVEEYQAVQEMLEDYRDTLIADEIYEAWLAGEEETVDHETALKDLGLDE